MNFCFHPEAEEELTKAIAYYSDISPQLGQGFAVEVFAAIQLALDFPSIWSLLEGTIRRSLVRGFPYGVLYSREENGIYIVAVMHLHQEPGYWKDRLT